MSTKAKVFYWSLVLLIGTSYWGYLTTKIHVGTVDSFATILGMGLGSSLPILAITGIICAATYYFSKNWKTAMWVWTVLVLIAMLFLTLGHSFIIHNV